MKILITIVSLMVLSSSALPTNPWLTVDDINSYVDQVLAQIKKYVVEKSLEPLHLPDQVTAFSYKDPLGHFWEGEASLRNGEARGLLSLFRTADVNITYSGQILSVSGYLGLTQMQFLYQFRATLMNQGPQGRALVIADEFRLGFQVQVNIATLKVTLTSSKLADIGDLDVSIFGMGPVFDLMSEVFGNLILDVCKGHILEILQPLISSLVQQGFSNFPLFPNGGLPPTSLPLLPTSLPLIPSSLIPLFPRNISTVP